MTFFHYKVIMNYPVLHKVNQQLIFKPRPNLFGTPIPLPLPPLHPPRHVPSSVSTLNSTPNRSAESSIRNRSTCGKLKYGRTSASFALTRGREKLGAVYTELADTEVKLAAVRWQLYS